MTTKYGDFLPTGYNTISDPYKRFQVSDRTKGLNLKAGTAKFGKGYDGYFNPFSGLYVGEKYQKTTTEKLAAISDKKKHRVTDHPFKPAAPMKESTGLGNYFGCIGGAYKHEKEYDTTGHKKGDFEVAPRNIVTNPPKSGTYGTRGTTLGEKLGATGAIGEYSYQASDYEAQRKQARADIEESKKMRVTDHPFKPANPPKAGGPGMIRRNVNGAKAHGVIGEYTYATIGPRPRPKLEVFEKPFRPSNPPKLGYNATLNKFPAYREDPLDVKLKAAKAERDAEHARLGDRNAFVPANVPRTKATPSVLRLNLNTL